MSGLVAEIPVVSPAFQAILDAIGAVLAWIYDLVPNYGVSIILLTVIVRLILLPLGFMQVRSMANMQRLQPKIKAIQNKYKGNRAKSQEEIMKLYRESGVNPLAGCWPVLLQFPILIAMYSVLRPPVYVTEQVNGQPQVVVSPGDNHLPTDSTLYQKVAVDHEGTDFVFMNMQCSAIQAGTGEVQLRTKEGDPTDVTIDCGEGIPVRIPYYAVLLVMIGSAFFQQKQMQRAAPPGSTNPQQQAIFKIMPLAFGVIGIGFPAGLVVYWTTSNLWQIGQQATMLKLGHIGPDARVPEPKKRSRRGLMARLAEQAQAQQRDGRGKGDQQGGTGSASGKQGPAPKKPSGGSSSAKKRGSGGSGAGSRKKRPKR
jgi:YidC/Oxa1 family membrane protein insertase